MAEGLALALRLLVQQECDPEHLRVPDEPQILLHLPQQQQYLCPHPDSEVSFVEHPKLEPVKEQGLQLLGCFQLKDDNKKQKLLFYSAEFIKNLEREDLTQSG